MIWLYYNMLIAPFAWLFLNSNYLKPNSLQLVHVIFRHGNRTNEALGTYPKDPYINETYYPYGLGQLTDKGKLKAYNAGKSLRYRYNEFLGDLYIPEMLDALSTNLDRTKMSLLLVLAGLFPPSEQQTNLLPHLNWQPIPYNYVDIKTDPYLGVPFYHCPKFIELYDEVQKSNHSLSLQKKYRQLFVYLSEYTGWNVTMNINILLLYSTLYTQDDLGFKLPTWTKSVYPDELEKLAMEEFKRQTLTSELRQLTGGFLMKKILDDTKAKIYKKENENNRKIFLYSVHDAHIMYLLSCLNLWDMRQPLYSSYVLLEVHKINDIYGFKIFYQNYVTSEPLPLTIPGCEHFCPIDELVKLIQDNLPKDNDVCKTKKSQTFHNLDLGNVELEKFNKN